MNSFDRHATVQVVSDARPMAAGYWGAWGGDANACVQNSFWSLDREFKTYVGAYVCLRFQGFAYDTTTSKNIKELAYASLTANQHWGYVMILIYKPW